MLNFWTLVSYSSFGLKTNCLQWTIKKRNWPCCSDTFGRECSTGRTVRSPKWKFIVSRLCVQNVMASNNLLLRYFAEIDNQEQNMKGCRWRKRHSGLLKIHCLVNILTQLDTWKYRSAGGTKGWIRKAGNFQNSDSCFTFPSTPSKPKKNSLLAQRKTQMIMRICQIKWYNNLIWTKLVARLTDFALYKVMPLAWLMA